MTAQFSALGIQLTLDRYPANQESNLQAWDAADEHLIKHIQENQLGKQTILVINDSFGALTCALLKQANDAEKIWHLTDAKTSRLGTQHNLEQNRLDAEQVNWLTSLDEIPQEIDLVLVKIPKNLTYFSYQLRRLSQVLPQGTQILISAKAKGINRSLLATIEQDLGPASASLTWKKTRVISCISDGKARKLKADSSWQVPEYQLTISNKANVFASNKLDIGARIMLENMPQGDFKQIVDLGCGNGVLGLRAAQLFPKAHIHFVDDAFMATSSTQENWQLNQLPEDQGHFYWDDCLTNLPQDVMPDLVLCNPPFHQGEAITDHIAWQMFLDARNRLVPGGIIHVVGNRHLGYHIKLKRLFKNCETVASNGKFVILQAKKH